ncbi:Hsp20/alpha crystallin family protein [Halobacteria archaeon AArc-dxtr1]|nr:Hsp20/alpha crystallin family protein [Halobacteria archaeon AArc-dxtr1]
MTPPEPGHPPDDDPDEPPTDRSTDDADNPPTDRSDDDAESPPAESDDADGRRDVDGEQPDKTVSPVDSGRPAGGWADDGGDGRSLLSSLLRALDSLDRISGSSHRGQNRRLEYDISIDTGIGDLESGRGRGGLPERETGGRGDDHSRSRRTRRRRPASSIPTTVQRRDDGVLVTADLAGVDPDSVTVGFDEDRLIIGVEGGEIERVAVPWPEPTTDAQLNNGVLSVRITPGGEESE